MDFLPGSSSLFWKTVRQETFKNWPFKSPENLCDPERMAAAGFYSIGTREDPDLVECFICSKQLNGWEPMDDPWKEHLNHQPSCAFVKLQKRDEYLWTVYDLFELIKAYNLKQIEQELDDAKSKIKEDAAKLVKQIPYLFKALHKSKRGN